MTKEQAILAGEKSGTELHYGECTVDIGPKGGKKWHIVRVRTNGKCQTWKSRPNSFRLPVVYGLKTYHAVNEENASKFHLASECPINFDPNDGKLAKAGK
jgi:hypothetical protein